MNEYSIFEFLPFKTLISQTQNDYYKSLALSDKSGKSTYDSEYMLNVIDKSLESLLNYNNRILKALDRLEYFQILDVKEFSRKHCMNIFRDLSSATASRDLKKGIELNMFESFGNLNKTKHIVK
jgi:Fic family protein